MASFVTVSTVITPYVFYSIDHIPLELKDLVFVIPTIESSFIIQYTIELYTLMIGS